MKTTTQIPACKAVFVSATGGVELTAVWNGLSALFALPSDTTETMAGEYHWQIQVLGNGWSQTIASGRLTVAESLFTKVTTGHDMRSWLDKAIDALQASIAGRASKVQLEMSFDNLSIKNMSQLDQLELLEKLEKKRAMLVLAKERKSGRRKGVGRLVKVEFI